MDTFKLLRDELVYELHIRGLPNSGDVSEIRKRLTKDFTDNVQPLSEIVLSLNIQQDIDICKGKFSSLAERIDELSVENIIEFRRLDARITHLHTRLVSLTVSSDLEALETTN